MMDYDDYLLATHGIDNGDDEDGDVPSHWHHIIDFDRDHDSDARELDLRDWLDIRVTEMLGEDGAEHMDTRGLVAQWMKTGLVEDVAGSWFFTRVDEANIWLRAK